MPILRSQHSPLVYLVSKCLRSLTIYFFSTGITVLARSIRYYTLIDSLRQGVFNPQQEICVTSVPQLSVELLLRALKTAFTHSFRVFHD